MEHIFIINPAAGATNSTHLIKSEIAKSKNASMCEVYCTKGPGDATDYVAAKCAESSNPIRFYACGGDGTLNEVVNGAVNFPHASVGCYPCGSGNDFVKYYGGAEGFLNIDNLINGVDYPIDLIRAGNKYCINVCDFGFDTAVIKTMEKVKTNKLTSGKRAYFTGVVKALMKSMKTPCKVTVDGEIICNGYALLCTIANGTYVGSSFRCAPHSKNDDGLLEVCLVKPVSRLRFFTLIGAYTNGTHLGDPRFDNCMIYRQGKNITIEGDSLFAYIVDGEVVNENRVHVEVVEKAINFIVPSGITTEYKKEMPAMSL